MLSAAKMTIIDLESEEKNEKNSDNWLKNTTSDFKQDLKSEKNVASLALSLKALEFTESTTMHGIRHVFTQDATKFRRTVWFVLIVLAMSYCTYVLTKTLQVYYTYPSRIDTSTTYEEKSEFPAVTICNYNIFQKSKMTPLEEKLVLRAFDGWGSFRNTNLNLSDFDHYNLTQFYYEKAYDYDLLGCFFGGVFCNFSILHSTLTDFGICKTYDPVDLESVRYQVAKGTSAGLDIGILIDANEWTNGPYAVYGGFRVAVHRPGTRPDAMKDIGFSVLKGLSTEVIIERKEVKLLPPPHGQCGSKVLKYHDTYSSEKCIFECQTNYTESLCGCKFPHMPGSAKVCTFKELNNCLTLLTFNRKDLFDLQSCNCPTDCAYTEYEVHVTNTGLSEGFSREFLKATNIDIARDAVQIRVFYSNLQFTEKEEVPIYTFERLLCDIGGGAGLFLGCSFATIVEFLDFSFQIFWLWAARKFYLKRESRIRPPV